LAEANLLVACFWSAKGVAQVTNDMPVGLSEDDVGFSWSIRNMHGLRGTMTFGRDCTSAFNFARDEHEVRLSETGAGGRKFTAPLCC
jgi:hypothetical protein